MVLGEVEAKDTEPIMRIASTKVKVMEAKAMARAVEEALCEAKDQASTTK